MPNPRLYFSPGSCSLAAHIALDETGAPYEAVHVDLAGGQQRSADYLAINPKGRVPALVEDGFTVTENPALLAYIAQTNPAAALWPDTPREAARAAEWLAWIAVNVHPAYAHIRRVERYATSEAAKVEVADKARETCRTLWGEIETKLADAGPWALGGRYTVVDPYVLVFWLWGRGPVLGYDMQALFPHWTAHAHRMADRPAVARVLASEGLERP